MSGNSEKTFDQTLNYYNTHAEEAFHLYTSHPSPFKDNFNRYFSNGSRILDVGSGSGRDVKALLAQNYDAYGMDAARELVSLSQSSLKCYSQRIQEGSLPYAIPPDFNKNSDWEGILCSGVLQHIPDKHLSDSMNALHRLLKTGGRLLITIPLEYPLISKDLDEKNRLFRIRPAREYIILLERLGFNLIDQREQSDSLKRERISWAELLFQKKCVLEEL